MSNLAKRCDILGIEEKWQRKWGEMRIYEYDWEDKTRTVFCIDTPPPYPSGEFHMGNVLNWTYFDITARYKRMKDYNVFFPQGWDCHGLGIEVQTEKQHKIRKRDVSPEKFRKMCEKLVDNYIGIMKTAIKRLGCSVDWTTEYKTMNPAYWKLTQLSFIELYMKGFIYQGTHPVNWCPRCETAIADAEIDYETRASKLHFIRFQFKDDEDESITIATTRPELIPACVAVAVHPEDERYMVSVGKLVKVPTTNREVDVISENEVDPEYGTGAVMICTYGDKADVKTVVKHNLPVIMIMAEDGRMNEKAGKYKNMTIGEAKEAILKDVEKMGILIETEGIQQEVGLCDRCKTPIEILKLKQWFMKTRVLTPQVEKMANKVVWYPDYMKYRLIDWAKSLEWDWVISRQRIFGTPIPAWYCEDCGEIITAAPEWVPIDPKLEDPKIKGCQNCGSSTFIPETDVFDTWMDSSISCAVHAGWPDRKDWRKRFPADLHPSGTDIIRTWAYYLMVRHLALFNEKPYKSCLINGMVLGSDGRKMSKSLGNYVTTSEVFSQYGADAARQWAAGGGTTGSDIPFRKPDIEYGRRFITKLWNATRFLFTHIRGYKPSKVKLGLLDRWLLNSLEKTIRKVTDAYEKCQFNIALQEIRDFTWHKLCDHYIEVVKDRLYKHDIEGQRREAARHVLYHTIRTILHLFAPIAPHITEEIFQLIYAEDENQSSIHISAWPVPNDAHLDEEAENRGKLVLTLIREVRREKGEKKLPLNTPLKTLNIYAESTDYVNTVTLGSEDIIETCKVEKLNILSTKGKGRKIQDYTNISFVSEY